MKGAQKRFWRTAKVIIAYAEANNLNWTDLPCEIQFSPAVSFFGRHISYLLGANPALNGFGDAFVSSKWDGYRFIPEKFLLKTQKITALDDFSTILGPFPLFLKPDGADQAQFAEKVGSVEAIRAYFAKTGLKYALLQEFNSDNVEASLLFYRKSDGKLGFGPLMWKKYPEVTGNGQKTVAELVQMHFSGPIAAKILQNMPEEAQKRVLDAGKTEIVLQKGSLYAGVTFIEVKNDPETLKKSISAWFPADSGVNIGRLDLKAANIEALLAGNVKVLELNGTKAVPQEIHTQEKSLQERYEVLLAHSERIYTAAKHFGVTGSHFFPYAAKNALQMHQFTASQAKWGSPFRKSRNVGKKIAQSLTFFGKIILFSPKNAPKNAQ